MTMRLIRVLCAVLLALGVARVGAASEGAVSLERGYQLMYGLDFASAEQVFAGWRSAHPRDPLAPMSQAANLLFSELYRSGILQSQLFVDDSLFSAAKTPVSADLRARFEAAVAETDVATRARLGEDAQDRDALFALAMAFGLRADFAALVEGRQMAALSYTRQATQVSRRLIDLAPDYADAHLANGLSQFIVGSLVAPMRWVLRIAGFKGDKRVGMQELQLTADGGRFLGPFARILLAIACLREHDTDRARGLLVGLDRDFPSNPLFARELQRMASKTN
jgi:hypothetical protein